MNKNCPGCITPLTSCPECRERDFQKYKEINEKIRKICMQEPDLETLNEAKERIRQKNLKK